MRKKLFLGLLLVTFFQLSTIVSVAQDGVTLKYNFKKGDSYAIKSVGTQTMTQHIMGQEMTINMKSSQSLRIDVAEISQENLKLIYKPDEILINTVAMGVDTTVTMSNIGSEYEFVTTPYGKHISTKMIKPSSIAALADLSQMLKNTRLISFPEKALEAGDSWKETLNDTIAPNSATPFQVVIKQDLQYVFVGNYEENGKTYYKITFSGPVEMSGSGNQMGMDMTIEGAGKSEGFSIIDPDTKMIVSTSLEMGIDSTISMVGQQNITVQFTQKVTEKITAEKIN